MTTPPNLSECYIVYDSRVSTHADSQNIKF